MTDYLARVIADTQASAKEYREFSRPGISGHPIPFFGDVETANVLTVGVNPSATEFINREWPLQQLSAAELADRLCRYFTSAPVPPHPWFATWSTALDLIGVSYSRGAAHLDLSPRATVAMGSISNWQGFASMVERDARWFFDLLSMREVPQMILIAGCVTKRWYMNDFIRRIAPKYGYELTGEAENSGEGRVGFLRLIGPIGESPVFFCSVSPSGQKRQILVERVREHRSAINKWSRVRKQIHNIGRADRGAASVQATFALGVDLGGSSIKAVAVTPDGALLAERNVSFDANEQFDWARRIREIVHELSDAAQRTSLSPRRAADEVSGNNQSLSGSRVRGSSSQRFSNTRDETDLDSKGMRSTEPSVVPTPHPGPLPVEGRGGTGAIAIGISAPGLAATDGRSIARMPGRLQGLEGLDWTEFLNAECGVRSAESEPRGAADDSALHTPHSAFVPVLNDAHAALLGEAWLGAARGFQNVFMLTLGTGVGGAAMVDGKLLRGRLGRAGHLGHICLDMDGARDVCAMPGSLEALIGNYSIEERTRGRFKTTHDLVEAHLRGDKEATEAWLKSVRALGYGIASLINVLDPEAVIIGGGIARSGAALFEPLEKFVRDAEWDVGATPVKILPAQLGEFAGAYGAAWNALQSISTQTAQK